MDGLTQGRMVHFVTPENVHLVAIVVKVHSKADGLVNLTVFIDHDEYTGDHTFRATSVLYSEDPKPHSWHWIEKA